MANCHGSLASAMPYTFTKADKERRFFSLDSPRPLIAIIFQQQDDIFTLARKRPNSLSSEDGKDLDLD